jgi:type I restriction enzyme S subunit
MAGEWQQHDIDQLISEGMLVIGDGYRAKNEELTDHGLPFARAGTINDGFQFEGADHFPAERLARVGNKVSQPGDVVFTSKGTVGRFAFVRRSTPQFVYSPQLCFWRSLDHWMFGREFFVQFKGVAGQTDMAEYVSLGDQRRMRITLPPLGEQQSIARILGTLDDKIELNRRMSETLEVMARTLFKSWFVDFDPVRAKAEGRETGLPRAIAEFFPDRFEESALGEIPQGWIVLALDEIARFVNGLALQKYPPREGRSLPVIKIAQLRAGTTQKADAASADLDPDYVVEDGDVLFSWSGSLECVVWAGGKGALNQHLFKVASADYPKWLFYLWIHEHLDMFRLIAAGKATTMGHIQRHHLSDATVCVPPGACLEEMDAVVAPLLDRALRARVENRTIEELRDALLPKLISGEVRVPAVERIVESHV